MITCDDCGKVSGAGDVGEHWICDSCRIPDEPSKHKHAHAADKGQVPEVTGKTGNNE